VFCEFVCPTLFCCDGLTGEETEFCGCVVEYDLTFKVNFPNKFVGAFG
jgi:hypothetical protein